MANLFQRAIAWMSAELIAGAGVEVDYVRGEETVNLTAWVGRTAFVSNMEKAARVEWGERDYLFRLSDLGELGEPQEGDRIVETIDSVQVTFELMAPLGEPPWRYSDPQRTVIRAHCKRVTP